MYLVRHNALDFSEDNSSYMAKDDEVLSVVDTDTGEVTKRTFKDIRETGGVNGVFYKEMFAAPFSDCLGGVVWLNNRNIWSVDSLRFATGMEATYVKFTDASGKEVLKIDFQFQVLGYYASFIWMQKIGDLGYRIVMRIRGEWKQAAVRCVRYAYVYLYCSNIFELSIEKVDLESAAYMSAEINEEFLAPKGIRSRLSVVKGTVF